MDARVQLNASADLSNNGPTAEEIKAMKSTTLFIGVPDDLAGANRYVLDGGRLIIFSIEGEDVKPLEEFRWSVPARVEWWRWQHDELLRKHLFERLPTFVGAMIGRVPNSERHKTAADKFTAIFRSVCELSNFDTRSFQFLSKDNLFTKNSFKNYRWVDDGIPMEQVQDALKGKEAFIVAAGPSLTDALPHIKRARESENPPVLLCAGRSYKLLALHGIMPDWVVEVEMFEWDHKIWTFAPPPDPDAILAFPLCVCPEVVTDWPSRKCVLIDLNMQALMGFKCGFSGGNSILHWLMNTASFLGCDPITMIGADLSYPKGSKDTHAEGTFHPWPKSVQVSEHSPQDEMWLPGNDGELVKSSPAYQNFATLCSIIASKTGKKFRNASLHGLKIEGAPVFDLASWGATESSDTPLSPPHAINQVVS